jgi:2-oxoglutarate ferredoxin oxidoreductase subunit beta
LPALNPLTVTLGITNVSFVAQVPDWNPPLLYQAIKAAHEHRGTSFVRIMQRCPVFSDDFCKPFQENPDRLLLLTHENGIQVDDSVKKLFSEHREHDPSKWVEAMEIARDEAVMPVGLLYHNPDAVVYEDFSAQGLNKTNEEKIEAIEKAFDAFAI